MKGVRRRDSCSLRCSRRQVQVLNVLGIHNVSLDITALMSFADESGIATLRECFAKLSQLVDIVLRQGEFYSVLSVKQNTYHPRVVYGWGPSETRSSSGMHTFSSF